MELARILQGHRDDIQRLFQVLVDVDLFDCDQDMPCRRTSQAFHDDHSCLGRAMTHFPRLTVFRTIQPFFGPFYTFELEHDDPFRMPVALECFGGATANNILTAIFFDRRPSQLLVLLVSNRIGHFNFNNHVSRHVSLSLRQHGTKRSVNATADFSIGQRSIRIRPINTNAITNTLISAFLIFFAGNVKAQAAPKVADGDFESPLLSGGYQHNLPIGPGQPWTFTGHSGIARNAAGGFDVSGPSTNQFGFLQSPNSSFSQTIVFSSAGEYTLSYSVAGRIPNETYRWGGNLEYIISIAASGSDKPLFSVNSSTSNKQPFKPEARRFSIPASGSYVLMFKGAPGPPHDDSALFDNITIKREPTQ